MRPPRVAERYVRVDVDLRNGVGSAGAQSHLNEPEDITANPSSAVIASDENSQNSQPVQLPDIHEVADMRRLDQHMYDRYSTRIMMQNEPHRSRNFSARCKCIVKSGAKCTVPIGKITADVDELSPEVDSI